VSGGGQPLLFSLLALAALVPAALLPLRAGGPGTAVAGRDALFWLALLLATAGPAAWAAAQISDSWHTGFSVTLWITIAVSMLVFAGVSALSRAAWRLAPLLLPYLLLLGILASIWQQGDGGRPLAAPPGPWIQVHIGVSVVTYALLTLAAVAGLGVLLQERALKAKRPTALTRVLPSVADGEAMQQRLLLASAVVLGLGLLTGMAMEYLERGILLEFDHKTLFVILSFAVICAALVAHYRSGVRGRRAAHYVLLAYLLLTLGYPGVKFVTDVLMAA